MGRGRPGDQRRSIARIQKLQNNNGTLSTGWLERPGVSSEVAERLSCTGHQLEFLTLALSEEQLQEPWVKRAVASLCRLFEETKRLPLECGALYHASHGLDLYQQRVYGPLEWSTGEESHCPACRPANRPREHRPPRRRKIRPPGRPWTLLGTVR